MRVEIAPESGGSAILDNGMARVDDRVYDSSCLSCFLRCPRRFFYRYLRRIALPVTHTALEFGLAFHRALDIYFEAHDLGAAMKSLEALPSVTTLGDNKRSREKAEVCLREYVDFIKQEPYKVIEKEVEFHVDVEGCEAVLSGRLDQLVEWDGSTFVRDFKTGSWPVFARPHLQFDAYCYACYQLIGRCDGLIIDQVSNADKPRSRVTRTLTPRTQGELTRFETQFRELALSLEGCVREGRWLQNTTSCGDYGGCDYVDLCVYGEEEPILARFVPVVVAQSTA